MVSAHDWRAARLAKERHGGRAEPAAENYFCVMKKNVHPYLFCPKIHEPTNMSKSSMIPEFLDISFVGMLLVRTYHTERLLAFFNSEFISRNQRTWILSHIVGLPISVSQECKTKRVDSSFSSDVSFLRLIWFLTAERIFQKLGQIDIHINSSKIPIDSDSAYLHRRQVNRNEGVIYHVGGFDIIEAQKQGPKYNVAGSKVNTASVATSINAAACKRRHARQPLEFVTCVPAIAGLLLLWIGPSNAYCRPGEYRLHGGFCTRCSAGSYSTGSTRFPLASAIFYVKQHSLPHFNSSGLS